MISLRSDHVPRNGVVTVRNKAIFLRLSYTTKNMAVVIDRMIMINGI